MPADGLSPTLATPSDHRAGVLALGGWLSLALGLSLLALLGVAGLDPRVHVLDLWRTLLEAPENLQLAVGESLVEWTVVLGADPGQS